MKVGSSCNHSDQTSQLMPAERHGRLQPFEVNVLQLDRRALIEEADGDDEPLSAPPLDDHSLDAPQWTASHADGLARFEPGFGSERLIGIDESPDVPQIGHEHGGIADRQPASDRVGRQCGPPLIVIDEGEYVAGEEWNVGKPRPPARRSQPSLDERRVERNGRGLELPHEILFAARERVKGDPPTAVGNSRLIEQRFGKDVSLSGEDWHG